MLRKRKLTLDKTEAIMQIISNTRTKRLAIPYKNIIFVNELQTYPIMKQTAYIYLLTLSCLLCACNRETEQICHNPKSPV